uniref:mannose-6-phosphate isomerase n=1 Tax=Panagrolaimus superbus TaxID=310955 RepID=A0A914Y3S1_9BILA
MAAEKIHFLDVHVMNYAWGRPANQSAVAKLAGGLADPTKTYAELWMGTHVNGPAQIPEKSTSLKEYISSNPQVLAAHENGDIQYLFKVLSVAKALSVQSHPTKDLAKELHAKDPKNYPDDNHKPEMTVALTEFEILCGFRKVEDIARNFEDFPETTRLVKESQIKALRDVAASSDETKRKAAIKDLFTSLMKASHEDIDAAIKVLISRLGGKKDDSELETLVQRLYHQYPDADVGVFAPLLLNYIKLLPGESVFLGPNEPHAYLDGECIECMACSDNTIRAGLTPKFKDVPTLVSSLTYNTAGPTYLCPKEVVRGIFEYKPPVPEFTVQRITVTFIFKSYSKK